MYITETERTSSIIISLFPSYEQIRCPGNQLQSTWKVTF